MRSFGHREELDRMHSETDEIWKEARLTGFGRIMRLGLSGLLMAGTVVLFFFLDAPYQSSPIVLLLLAALLASGVYDVLKVLKRRLFWNDDGIKRAGLFGEGRLHLWEDLTYVERSMHDRATVLTFKGLWKIKVYWSYKAHKEIASLAKAKLKQKKSGRKKAPKTEDAPKRTAEPVFTSRQRQETDAQPVLSMEETRDSAVLSLGSKPDAQEKT